MKIYLKIIPTYFGILCEYIIQIDNKQNTVYLYHKNMNLR